MMIEHSAGGTSSGHRSFRSAVLRGLGVVVPPLLTVVIFLWIAGTIQSYFLRPVNSAVQWLLVTLVADLRTEQEIPESERRSPYPRIDGVAYQRLPDRSLVPRPVYEAVRENPGSQALPSTGQGVYRRYVEVRYLRPYLTVPLILALFLLGLYLLGHFMAARIGRGLWSLIEGAIGRVPLVRNVYSAVKQVSDFVLSDRQIAYSRVVAIQYPRKGIWSLGLVTGEGIPAVASVAGEPVVSVLVPTSPMPMTGFTAICLKSETVDLNLTIDQAIQYLVSCGVVLPPGKLQALRRSDADRPGMSGSAESAERQRQD